MLFEVSVDNFLTNNFNPATELDFLFLWGTFGLWRRCCKDLINIKFFLMVIDLLLLIERVEILDVSLRGPFKFLYLTFTWFSWCSFELRNGCFAQRSKVLVHVSDLTSRKVNAFPVDFVFLLQLLLTGSKYSDFVKKTFDSLFIILLLSDERPNIWIWDPID